MTTNEKAATSSELEATQLIESERKFKEYCIRFEKAHWFCVGVWLTSWLSAVLETMAEVAQ